MIVRKTKQGTIEDAFDHFAKSIVIQAIEDYRDILNNKRIKHVSSTKYNKTEIEKFFLSDWCYLLCGFNGEWLIKEIKQQENYHDPINKSSV